jgi:hypothetical protein
MESSDPVERWSVGRESAREFLGVADHDLEAFASDHGVNEVRVVMRDGWFSWSPQVVAGRVSVVIRDGAVTRAWWA